MKFKADPLCQLPVDFGFQLERAANRALEMSQTSHRKNMNRGGTVVDLRSTRATVLDFVDHETGESQATSALDLCVKTRPGAAAKILDSLMHADSDQGWTFEVGVEFLRLQELQAIDIVRKVHDSGHFRLLEHQAIRQLERAMWSKFGRKCFFQRFGLYLVFALGTSLSLAWTRDTRKDSLLMLAMVCCIQPFNFFYLWIALDALCSRNYPRHTRFYYLDVMTHSMVLIFSLFIMTCYFDSSCSENSRTDESLRAEIFDCISALTAVLVWIKTTK